MCKVLFVLSLFIFIIEPAKGLEQKQPAYVTQEVWELLQELKKKAEQEQKKKELE